MRPFSLDDDPFFDNPFSSRSSRHIAPPVIIPKKRVAVVIASNEHSPDLSSFLAEKVYGLELRTARYWSGFRDLASIFQQDVVVLGPRKPNDSRAVKKQVEDVLATCPKAKIILLNPVAYTSRHKQVSFAPHDVSDADLAKLISPLLHH